MTEETIRPSEEEILVFISSRQDEEMAEARSLAINTVDEFPGVRVWAFEDAPASSEAARERYIRNAGRAEIVIWLIGSTTTDPVAEEIEASLLAGNKLIPFKLPAQQRDCRTKELMDKVQTKVTWRTVERVEKLPEHIRVSLADEMIRGFRDPAPMNHDQYLRYELRKSLAETKRLWTTLGVPDDIANELAEDESIGYKIQSLHAGISMVSASQGSGKTLAARRLYQHAITKRLDDHLQPLPLLLIARNIHGDLSKHLEDTVRGQGNVSAQPLLVIIDGLDEVGRYKANQILDQVVSFGDVHQDTEIVVMTRALPGLKITGESIHLSQCTEDEFIAIVSKVAGRSVDGRDIPYRLSKTRLPLFAVILGMLCRDRKDLTGSTPSQIVNLLLVQRILEEAEHVPEETAEPLKKLAVTVTNLGASVNRIEVDPRASVHQQLADSRIVAERGGKFDFELAIFREWFASRALVEKTINLEDTDLESDRWIVPMAIAINSGLSCLSDEVMSFVASKDPGLASLILEEVKDNWSALEFEESQLAETPMEIGSGIRQAMICWKAGLGQLMPVIGPLNEKGEIPSVAVSKGSMGIGVAWYEGEEKLPLVVEQSERIDSIFRGLDKDWPRLRIGPIEPTRVWKWSYTRELLSDSLADQLDFFELALESPLGVFEFAAEFAEIMSRGSWFNTGTPTIEELIACVDQWTKEFEEGEIATITIGERTYTKEKLKLIHTKLLEVSAEGGDYFLGPWPGSDKPWPKGKRTVWWHELYTEERLLERTQAIFRGALQIYNNIVSKRLNVFNRRSQMTYMKPLRIEGALRTGDRSRGKDPSLSWWRRVVKSRQESGVFFYLLSSEQELTETELERLREAREEMLKSEEKFEYTIQALRNSGPRPATMLAHEWLTSDLTDLGWLGNS